MNKNHQVNEYLYVVWWISKRERPEPICGQQPGVVEAKICSNSLFYIMLCYCLRGVGNKNSYPFPYNSESLFVGVGDK